MHRATLGQVGRAVIHLRADVGLRRPEGDHPPTAAHDRRLPKVTMEGADLPRQPEPVLVGASGRG
jgi:hypothetical protein